VTEWDEVPFTGLVNLRIGDQLNAKNISSSDRN